MSGPVKFDEKSQIVKPAGNHPYHFLERSDVVLSGGAPTAAGTSVFIKHNWDMGMGYLWLNGWGIYT